MMRRLLGIFALLMPFVATAKGNYKVYSECTFENKDIRVIKKDTDWEGGPHPETHTYYRIIGKANGKEVHPDRAFDAAQLPEVNKAIHTALEAQKGDLWFPALLQETVYVSAEGCNGKAYHDIVLPVCQFYPAKDGWHVLFNNHTEDDVPFTRPDLFNDPRLSALGK